MNPIAKMAVKSLIPMMGDAIKSGIDLFKNEPLQEGEVNIMLCIYPLEDEIMVAPMAVDESGQFKRSIWPEPRVLNDVLTDMIQQSGI